MGPMPQAEDLGNRVVRFTRARVGAHPMYMHDHMATCMTPCTTGIVELGGHLTDLSTLLRDPHRVTGAYRGLGQGVRSCTAFFVGVFAFLQTQNLSWGQCNENTKIKMTRRNAMAKRRSTKTHKTRKCVTRSSDEERS